MCTHAHTYIYIYIHTHIHIHTYTYTRTAYPLYPRLNAVPNIYGHRDDEHSCAGYTITSTTYALKENTNDQ